MLIVDLGVHCVSVGNMVDAPTSLTQKVFNTSLSLGSNKILGLMEGVMFN
jgi:hypothetical protein